MTKKRQDAEDVPDPQTEAEPELASDEDVTEAAGNGKAAAADGSELVAKKDEEIAGLKDQLLRLAADFDNFRKRVRKEQEEVRKYGNETLLQDVLPVLDNLERALAHADNDKSPVLQGVRMVAKQLVDALGRYGVQTFATVGKAFDPEKHEAVSQQPSEEKPGTIVSELQKGYVLHDRLLRPARVVVAIAVTKEEGKPADARQGD
jgi:molecular chaperone GrpE